MITAELFTELSTVFESCDNFLICLLYVITPFKLLYFLINLLYFLINLLYFLINLLYFLVNLLNVVEPNKKRFGAATIIAARIRIINISDTNLIVIQ
jgi:hypothetical protein